MASWAIHFRISDYFISKLDSIDKEYFVIGNIAPDCGVPVDGGYFPPSEVTHLTTNGHKSDCDYDLIYRTHIVNEKEAKKRSFWLGYFVHLATDCLFAEKMCYPVEWVHGSFFEKKELWRAVKREWYNLDFAYFAENISESFEIFKSAKGFFESYPKFYKNNEISRQMQYIKDFYSDNKPKEIEYIYCTADDVDLFIKDAEEFITNLLTVRKIM